MNLKWPQETRIAEAVVARLQLLGTENGLFLRHVGEAPRMPSRLDDAAWQMMLQKLRGQAPAALVIIDAARTDPGGMSRAQHRWQREYDITIAVLSTHRRDTVTGRLNPDVASQGDDTLDPGIRATCEWIDRLLLGWNPGIDDVCELRPGPQGMQTVYAGAEGTMRELEYRVEAAIERTSWPDDSALLDAVHTSLSVDAWTLDMETRLS